MAWRCYLGWTGLIGRFGTPDRAEGCSPKPGTWITKPVHLGDSLSLLGEYGTDVTDGGARGARTARLSTEHDTKGERIGRPIPRTRHDRSQGAREQDLDLGRLRKIGNLLVILSELLCEAVDLRAGDKALGVVADSGPSQG